MACLHGEGYNDMINLVSFYKENAKILLAAFKEMGFSVYGGKEGVNVGCECWV